MTRYTVVWLQSALDELAELWMSSREQGAVAQAANEIDEELRTDADIKGVDVGEDILGLVVPPLKILFAVNEQDRKAVVFRVNLL